MTVQDFLNDTTKTLQQASIPSARLDTLLLLEDALDTDRAHLLAHPERQIPSKTAVELSTKVVQRAHHTPLAYIRGRAMFYGRSFIVNRQVLVPRPESETLIELLNGLPLPERPRIADIGTGSGCLGITAGLQMPTSRIDLYDIDKKALEVAERNARQLGVTARAITADLLDQLYDVPDVILANLPYVPEALPINQAASFEPRRAIFSGPDGLAHYTRFWLQVQALTTKPRFIITESLPAQHHQLAVLARQAGYFLAQTSGFAQLFESL